MISALSMSSCGSYDDTPLWDKVNDHEDRITALEEQCTEMNSNIEALRALIEAMEGGNYITKVEPIEENGVVVGYTISFAEGDPITIYHGKDGKDGEDGKDGANGTGGGAAPQIGIRQDTDGAYYWTLDGEWLFDDNGNKVKAVGEDGKDGKDGEDGITPELKIENDYWYISYDNGASWTELGKAKGEDGQDGQGGQGGSSLFKSVTQDDNYVYFTLSDNSVITIAKSVELSIEFDLSAVGEVTINTEVEVPFAVASASESVDIEVVPTEDLTAEVVAYDNSRKSGHILIRTGSRHDAASKVIVLVSNGDKVIMKTIAVYVKAAEESAQLYIYNGATKSALASGGVITLAFMTNVACEAVIPEDVSWLSLDETRALNYDSIKLRVAQNGGDRRSAKVKVQSLDGALSIEYTITQAAVSSSSTPDVDDDGNILGTPATHEIFYTSTDGSIVEPNNVNVFGAVLLTNTYENGVGVLSFDRPVTIIGQSAFYGTNKITEIVLPDDVEKIDKYAFYACSALKSINIPDGVKSIGNGAFGRCKSLTSITIPDSVTTIYSGYLPTNEQTFGGCTSLTIISLGNGLTKIDTGTFVGCSSITSITIPDSITSISGCAFGDCSSLTSITIPDSVTSIGNEAFYDCSKLESVTLSENLTSISNSTFSGCTSLINIYIPNSVTAIGKYAFYGCSALSEVSIGSGVKTIGEWAFENCTSLISVVIPDNVTTIDKNAFELCRGLESVEIGTGVTKINAAAFRYCYALENIKCKATTPPTIAEDTFFGLGINPVIYVPMAMVDDYKAATYWSDLADIITGYEE